MKITNRWVWRTTIGFLLVIGAAAPGFGQTIRGRWDIISVQGTSVLPGGVAEARAEDPSCRIIFTGSGTFVARPGREARPRAVTGGGRWQTSGNLGLCAAEGTYRVTGLVRFDPAPGTLPLVNDRVGDPDEASAGLLVLRIAYSDGTHGILVLSCHLDGTPDTVFEGVTATKGFVHFWRRVPPSDFPFVDANRTLFHIRVHGHDDDHDDDDDD